MSHKVDFDAVPFTEGLPYSRAKTFINGNQRIRVVEFREGFIEPDWCVKGHIGYMLEGSFSIDFDGETERFGKGDVFLIPAGEEHRHKAVPGPGEKALVLLVETV